MSNEDNVHTKIEEQIESVIRWKVQRINSKENMI